MSLLADFKGVVMTHSLNESTHLFNSDESRVKDIKMAELFIEIICHNIFRLSIINFRIFLHVWGSNYLGSSSI